MIECQCVSRHLPRPIETSPWTTPRGVVWLCPTAGSNLKVLLRIYEDRNGSVPGSLTKHFGKYLRDLAEEIYFKEQ